jgi:hypothetical protein
MRGKSRIAISVLALVVVGVSACGSGKVATVDPGAGSTTASSTPDRFEHCVAILEQGGTINNCQPSTTSGPEAKNVDADPEIADLEAAFRQFLASRNGQLGSLDAAGAIDAMTSFYEAVQPTGLDPEAPDMLLFQWGTYDWGDGLWFEFNVTRQVITPSTPEDADDAIWQLGLTLRYPPTENAQTAASGEQWWDREDGPIAEFLTDVQSTPGWSYAAERRPTKVELSLDQAG